MYFEHLERDAMHGTPMALVRTRGVTDDGIVTTVGIQTFALISLEVY